MKLFEPKIFVGLFLCKIISSFLFLQLLKVIKNCLTTWIEHYILTDKHSSPKDKTRENKSISRF